MSNYAHSRWLWVAGLVVGCNGGPIAQDTDTSDSSSSSSSSSTTDGPEATDTADTTNGGPTTSSSSSSSTTDANPNPTESSETDPTETTTDPTETTTDPSDTDTDTGPIGTNECNDGIDNDGDGFADWQGDFGCYGPGDKTEAALPRDQEDGFTTFEFPADSVVVYVSNEGSDANDGLSPETCVFRPS